jgi:hypothetical protein
MENFPDMYEYFSGPQNGRALPNVTWPVPTRREKYFNIKTEIKNEYLTDYSELEYFSVHSFLPTCVSWNLPEKEHSSQK